MKKIILDKNQIYEFQQNREPYLMIDYANEIIPGKSAKGYKDFNDDEWFFKVHWPEDPNMPGFLQIEALTQMCSLSILTLPGNKGELMYLTSANNIILKKKVTPNSRLDIVTKVIKYTRGFGLFEASGYVDEKLVCSAEINLVLPKEIKKYKIK